MGFVLDIGDDSSDGVRLCDPAYRSFGGVRSRLADARRRKCVLGFHRRLRFALGHFSPSEGAAAAPSPVGE